MSANEDLLIGLPVAATVISVSPPRTVVRVNGTQDEYSVINVLPVPRKVGDEVRINLAIPNVPETVKFI